MTVYVLVVALVSATGGMLFGFGKRLHCSTPACCPPTRLRQRGENAPLTHLYPAADIGIVGGVEAMASFQQQFFPDIYAKTTSGVSDDPCASLWCR
jgi:hypothetical protein